MRSDEQAIREAHSTWIDAVNAGDLARLLVMTTDDVVFLNPGEECIGRDGFSTTFSAGSSPFCKRCAHRQRHLLNRKGHCHRIEAKGYQDSAAAGTSGGGSPARKAASWARNSDSPTFRQRVTSWTTAPRVKSRRC
jgi:ketosteroid isomerase-like protein